VCKNESTGPAGTTKALAILGYSAEDKVYTYYGIDSMGMASGAKGTLTENVWSWSGQDKLGGKLIKSRYTITRGSPDYYTFKWEISQDGKTWAAVMEGKETRGK
jgi:hypothetical protein